MKNWYRESPFFEVRQAHPCTILAKNTLSGAVSATGMQCYQEVCKAQSSMNNIKTNHFYASLLQGMTYACLQLRDFMPNISFADTLRAHSVANAAVYPPNWLL